MASNLRNKISVFKGIFLVCIVCAIVASCIKLRGHDPMMHDFYIVCYDMNTMEFKPHVRVLDNILEISTELNFSKVSPVDEDIYDNIVYYYYNDDRIRIDDKAKRNAYEMIMSREDDLRSEFSKKKKELPKEYRGYQPAYYQYSYIAGSVSVTCDTKLFGREPGSNIADMFNVANHCFMRVIGPNLTPIFDDYPVNIPLTDYYVEKIMMSDLNVFRCNMPEELREHDATLHFHFPLISENYWKYCLCKARGEEIDESDVLESYNLEFDVNISKTN